MANKDQKNRKKEIRKPKKEKAKAAAATSPFVVTAGKGPGGTTKK
jgi:hypothetical protein